MKEATQITLRDYPYPFKAFLAICSDLDETPGENTYLETMKYLNTAQNTIMGPGVGLEVGNTIYFEMPEGHFSYWNCGEETREKLCVLMRSGHIDCLHSFGDLASNRSNAAQALEELARRNCDLKVWIDHAIAPTNLGTDIMKGGGDIPGHPAYHSDLTTSYGVKYVWRGRVTSIIGQNVPLNASGIWNVEHPLRSAKTLSKELLKHVMARVKPDGKYSLHGGNKVFRPISLSNGTSVYEFIRANPHWGGVSCCDTGGGIGKVLTQSFCDTLKARRATTILYTHLGKLHKSKEQCQFSQSARQAFHLLALYKKRGDILVSTTCRLLDYHRVKASLDWTSYENQRSIVIGINTREKNNTLQGLTFYTNGDKNNQIHVNGIKIETIINPPDETGKASISIPWKPLAFPL